MQVSRPMVISGIAGIAAALLAWGVLQGSRSTDESRGSDAGPPPSASPGGKQPEASDAAPDVGPDGFNALTQAEARVLLNRGTERAYTGEYTDLHDAGTYICRRCNSPLYRSEDKFESHCGWPSFDDEIPDAVERHVDADQIRTEIVCKHCGGHLGHVFFGEGMTNKDTRHCVNSISMRFVARGKPLPEVRRPKD